MPPRPSSGELWGQCFMSLQVEVSFLMPNGIFIILKVDRDSTLQSIKEVCWKEAQLYPAYNLLQEASNYIFVGVTQNGEKEQFYDELRRFCDLRLFQPILKIIEHVGNRNEKIFNAKISFMIGISSGDTNTSKRDLEEIAFKENITDFCKSIVAERDSKGIEGLALYYFPPDIFPNSQIPLHIYETLKRDHFKFKLTVWLSVQTNDRCKFTLHTKYDVAISQVVIESLRKKLRSEKVPAVKQEAIIHTRAANVVVKVCGYNEYLLGNYPLCQYKYIRQSLVAGRLPELMLVDRSAFHHRINKNLISCPRSNDKVIEAVGTSKDVQRLSLWSVDTNFRVKINSVSNLVAKENSEIFVKVGLYQAQEPLCQSVCTQEVCSSEGRWDEWVELGVRVRDVPRSAQLCVALCYSEPKKNKKKEESFLLQSSVSLFDFNGVFLDSRKNNNDDDDDDDSIKKINNNSNNNSTTNTTNNTNNNTNNITTNATNINNKVINNEVNNNNNKTEVNNNNNNNNKTEVNNNNNQNNRNEIQTTNNNDTKTINCNDKAIDKNKTEINNANYNNDETQMELLMWTPHPASEDLLSSLGSTECSRTTDSASISISLQRMTARNEALTFPPNNEVIKHALTLTQKSSSKYSKKEMSRIEEIKGKDPLSELSEQDKLFLWKMREFLIKKAYTLLPKLVQSVKWNNKDDVAVLHELLTRCPTISTVTSLELLHSCYLDLNTRTFAVKCLEDRLSTYHLSHYLLQLVHALEFEQYYDNSLLRFLLKRALNNQKLGQAFFWYLRSLMQHSRRSAYYAVILDAYLRHCGHLECLCKQVEAVDKLNKLSETIKAEKDENQVKRLQELLQKQDCAEVLNNILSPLNATIPLDTLDISRCDVKSSKKRPILLTWKNSSSEVPLPASFQVIFKTGDDLRQDMLTLQVFELMNGIWEMEGLDVRLIPYRCLATAPNAGIIEVVSGAKTVMQVMGKDFNSRELHNWIREHNPPLNPPTDRCAYQHAVDTFMRSCAGYCVATFVLGIGDRHPSNIMVTQSGQVFHIDFGHFLNHRKKKFGINRERVPFVLTEDFIRVIAKGQDNPEKSVEFANFMELCGKAYLYLRKHANLIISLFSMMLSSGMPELQSADDVEYLRKTLMVESRLDQEALTYFQDRFNEAYRGAWTTKVDWFFHWVKHST